MNENAHNEDIQKMLGTATFGKQSLAANVPAQIELCRRNIPLKDNFPARNQPSPKNSEEGSEDNDDEEDDDDDDDDNAEFPISHDLVLKTHEKAITSITLDVSATRMVTSSTDCRMNFHDFASMTPTTLRAFRSKDPTATKDSNASESHPIRLVAFQPRSATHLLVVTAHPQAMIYTRDGDEKTKFVKGDMYIQDVGKTKGHVSELTCGCWHPTNPALCLTAGTDSSLRIWNVESNREQKHIIVYRPEDAVGAGRRSRITAVAWQAREPPASTIIVFATLDGSLVMYNGEGPYTRPMGIIRDAHQANTWTSGVAISIDGRLIVSRGGDDTVKLWDVRKFEKPLSTASIPLLSSPQYPTSNIAFSPFSTHVILGNSAGHLLILSTARLKMEVQTSLTPGSALITVQWNAKLNQIIAASANGEIHILFNPEKSKGGAMTILSKPPKRRHIDDDPNMTMDTSQGFSGDSIIAPGAGNRLGSNRSGKSKTVPDARRPHQPMFTPFAKNAPSEEHIINRVPLSSMKDEDSREALLKYADQATNDPLYTKAWESTQPTTIYGEIEDEPEPNPKKIKR